MALGKNGYSKTFTKVAAGTHYFKVVADHAWTKAWPTEDYKLTLDVTSNVTILFNDVTGAITVTTEPWVCAHANTSTTTEPATCGKDGKETVTCTDCAAPLSSKVLPATGDHKFSNGTCSGCGAGCSHNWVDGTCSVCNMVCTHNWSDGSCTICQLACDHNYTEGTCSGCGAQDPNYVAGNAQIGDTVYATLADAIAAATEGATITLIKDAQQESLMLLDKIDLDLNGFTLTVDHMTAFPGSAIVDTVGTGLLKVNKDKLILQKDNGYLPIWNGVDGYVLIAFNQLSSGEFDKTDDSVVYKFLPSIGADAFQLLTAGAETSGVQMQVVVTWEKGNGLTGSAAFTYSDALIQAFFADYDAESDQYGSVFTLALSGTAGKELSYQVCFISDTGVELACTTVE